MKEAPVFVATFADGETVRMTTHCKGKFDWERGRSLAKHAWQTRDRRHRIEKFLASNGNRKPSEIPSDRLKEILADIKDREPPEIAADHFEVDGQPIEEQQKEQQT
jgi:hypothetical protein